MPFNATSYFAGVLTVLATVAIGFGGGILMTDALVGQSEKTTSVAKRAGSLNASTAGPPQAAAIAPSPPQAADINVSSRPVQPASEVPAKPAADAMARAGDAEMKQVVAAERQKSDRRKRAERRKREFRRIEQQKQLAEQTREDHSFSHPPRITLFPPD